jgi:hypothetical protein
VPQILPKKKIQIEGETTKNKADPSRESDLSNHFVILVFVNLLTGRKFRESRRFLFVNLASKHSFTSDKTWKTFCNV